LICCAAEQNVGDVFVVARLVAELQLIEALDVFGMMKASHLNSLTVALTEGKVCYHLLCFLT